MGLTFLRKRCGIGNLFVDEINAHKAAHGIEGQGEKRKGQLSLAFFMIRGERRPPVPL